MYDGNVWKHLEYSEGVNFLSQRNNYGFFLNVDWYQPYKNQMYSIGVIYMVILNLLREIQYKRENVILVSLIPGPKEPPLTINSYIYPLVSELLELWYGVIMEVREGQVEKVSCAIVGVGCDLPAGHKLCGFLSHSANLGCSCCFKEFSRGFGSRDYSGFDHNHWKMRTNEEHRKRLARIVRSANKTEQDHLQSELGCRYSSLLQLPYFDPIRMLTIDPMHNLFLGTAKYMVRKVWIEHGYLNASKLSVIEERLVKFTYRHQLHLDD